ncbi:MAG: hypothetical protein F6K42_00560 [Leptolyngbya sp. SIO1D8]|nr:hypothetical protein [Leptolyngbya sp. SIO1D8]
MKQIFNQKNPTEEQISLIDLQLRSMSSALATWQKTSRILFDHCSQNSDQILSLDRALSRHTGKLGELEQAQGELKEMIHAQSIQIAMLVDGIQGIEASFQAAIERQEAMLLCHLAEHEDAS